MLNFISENLATLLILAVVAVLIIVAVRKIIKDKKAGKGACSMQCDGCPNATACKSYKDEN